MCNDDVITVPDMLHRDIQLYFPSLRAYHCGIWYLVANFVDDLPHHIKSGKKSYGLSDHDVVNLQTSLKYTISSFYKCYGLSLQNMALFELLDLKHNFNHTSFDHPKGKYSPALYLLESRIDFICQFPCKIIMSFACKQLTRGH